MTSATLPVSAASRPKARSVLPATSAAFARSVPEACASCNVASVALIISPVVKPRRANDSSRPATSDAVKTVDFPRSLANCSSCLNSSPVAPLTAFTFDMEASKSAATLNELVPMAASGAVSPMVSFRPVFCKFRCRMAMLRCTPFRSFCSLPVLAPKIRLNAADLAMSYCFKLSPSISKNAGWTGFVFCCCFCLASSWSAAA